MTPDQMTFEWLRTQVVGIDSLVDTPFGPRLLVYCDYTASGRCLLFVERYLTGLQRMYANTHTEDDITGRSMTQLLHEAEAAIKQSVNAGESGRLIAIGTGATGAVYRLQQIIGVALPPATKQLLLALMTRFLGSEGVRGFQELQSREQPVVFVGPYEHHSNEVSWRQGLATVVEVRLSVDGGIDLDHLDELLRDSRFKDRLRIGAFSAASNVTGQRSNVPEIAELLHRRGALACFDYAASGAYVEIDMNPPAAPDGTSRSVDALYLSPHKFLGGPGSTGLLLFNQRIYQRDLEPTIAGGGTVDYVGPVDQDFIADVEVREQAGTPGVLQTLKAALAFQIKDALGTDRIERRERQLLGRAFERWQRNDGIEILGSQDPARRVAIVSFNVRHPCGLYLHPKFITALLNDLFGIQSRAGCSCAGPYGHRLLNIDTATSRKYRDLVRMGFHGMKPGWCRVGFHYVMDDAEADYVIDAVDFIGREGHRFLGLYGFDVRSGSWMHSSGSGKQEPFSLGAALKASEVKVTAMDAGDRARLYSQYLDYARRIARDLPSDPDPAASGDSSEFGSLKFFVGGFSGVGRPCINHQDDHAP